MKNILTSKVTTLSLLILCLLVGVKAYAKAAVPQKYDSSHLNSAPSAVGSIIDLATPKKCGDGWQESPVYKVCTGGSVQEDPSDPRTCLLQNVTCNGTLNTSLSVQPHQFPNLNVCSGYLTIGACSSSPVTQLECQQSWEQSSAYQSQLCTGGPLQVVNGMCQLQMTCQDTDTGSKVNNGSLTYPSSYVSTLQVCSGLLKTGACKRQ